MCQYLRDYNFPEIYVLKISDLPDWKNILTSFIIIEEGRDEEFIIIVTFFRIKRTKDWIINHK
jgi:hypothetical protein